MVDAGKIQENRVRRMAARQGLRLEKSRRRDPLALDFGSYMLIDERTERIVFGPAGGMASRRLEEVETYLTSKDAAPSEHTQVEVLLGSSVPAINRCSCGNSVVLVRSMNDTTWLACESVAPMIEIGNS